MGKQPYSRYELSREPLQGCISFSAATVKHINQTALLVPLGAVREVTRQERENKKKYV